MTSFFFVVSYCHLSATLQTMSIIVETYNRAAVRNCIALLRFSVDSPSYDDINSMLSDSSIVNSCNWLVIKLSKGSQLPQCVLQSSNVKGRLNSMVTGYFI